MASGDIFYLFQGYTSSTNIFRIQVQKSGGIYQVRIGARNDAGTYSLWIGGTLKAALTGIDNNNQAVDFVRLRAQGMDNGTRGTIYFEDFESRRFSEIGLLPDLGIHLRPNADTKPRQPELRACRPQVCKTCPTPFRCKASFRAKIAPCPPAAARLKPSCISWHL